MDPARYTGVYERASMRMEFFEADGGLRLRQTATGPIAELLPEPTQELDLVPVAEGLFVLRAPGTETWMPVTFYSLPTGEPYVHAGVRATPKVS